MTTPPTPSEAKTREEWRQAFTVSAIKYRHFSTAESKSGRNSDDAKMLWAEYWDSAAEFVDAIMSMQASETKLQAENQELRAEVERLREDAAKSSEPEKCDFCLGHGGLPSGGGPPCPLCDGTGIRQPNELSACPFCGENENVSVKESENGELLFWAECGSCRVTTDIETTPDKALAKWNRRATPPGYELVPEGTEAKNQNLLFYEYETDLLLAAKALESSMPNAAGRVRWLASLLAKTKPPKETPNAQG